MAIQEDRSAASAASMVQSPSDTTILIVDDDPAVVRMLRSLFEELGHRVIEAANGREAIARHRSHDDIELIISDLEMPEMDGLEMCRCLDGSDTRVIIISGTDVEPDEICASAAPIVGFVAKPFDVGELVSAANDAMGL